MTTEQKIRQICSHQSDNGVDELACQLTDRQVKMLQKLLIDAGVEGYKRGFIAARIEAVNE
jgi:hypothetical protein